MVAIGHKLSQSLAVPMTRGKRSSRWAATIHRGVAPGREVRRKQERGAH